MGQQVEHSREGAQAPHSRLDFSEFESGQQRFQQFAVHGQGNGEATHKEIGAPASGIKIRQAKSPDAPDKDL